MTYVFVAQDFRARARAISPVVTPRTAGGAITAVFVRYSGCSGHEMTRRRAAAGAQLVIEYRWEVVIAGRLEAVARRPLERARECAGAGRFSG